MIDQQERDQIKAQILQEINKAAEKKDKFMTNSKLLDDQKAHLKKIFQEQKNDNLKYEKELNDQFENDDTLACAFPRIHVPTSIHLKKVKKAQ